MQTVFYRNWDPVVRPRGTVVIIILTFTIVTTHLMLISNILCLTSASSIPQVVMVLMSESLSAALCTIHRRFSFTYSTFLELYKIELG